MTVSKQIGIFLVAATLSLFALKLGEQLSIPGMGSFISTAEAIRRASTNACELCWRGTTHGAALRSLLLGVGAS